MKNEFVNMGHEELTKKCSEMRKNLFNIKMQLSLGKCKNTSEIKKLRRDIARIKTIMHQKKVVQSEGGRV